MYIVSDMYIIHHQLKAHSYLNSTPPISSNMPDDMKATAHEVPNFSTKPNSR